MVLAVSAPRTAGEAAFAAFNARWCEWDGSQREYKRAFTEAWAAGAAAAIAFVAAPTPRDIEPDEETLT